MKILLAAPEAVPYCKTGGLADVAGALAGELARAGHEPALFLPRYRAVAERDLDPAFSLALPGPRPAVLRRSKKLPRAYFIDIPEFFDREGLYGDARGDYPDNGERFAAYARAVLDGARAAGFSPDVVHAHDWQAGLIPLLLRERADRPASLLTIHNLAYQGVFPPEVLDRAGVDRRWFTPEGIEFYGKASYLKAGLVFSDLITTVSPTYAREIQESSERGFGLEGLLRRRQADLFGVINGLDTTLWDPELDPHIARRYGAADAEAGKAACKAALQRRCGLALEPRRPLIGIVSRFDRQKGLDLALPAVELRLDRCQLVALGTGDPALADAFASLARRRPDAAYLHSGFDEAFAHQVYAGCDLFLMPSRFEPCGLGQMIAMRYGALPVASRTGGLADTVVEDGSSANGFLCRPGDGLDLGGALDRALDAYASPAWWPRARTAMRRDFSWGRSVERMIELYARARDRSAQTGRA